MVQPDFRWRKSNRKKWDQTTCSRRMILVMGLWLVGSFLYSFWWHTFSHLAYDELPYGYHRSKEISIQPLDSKQNDKNTNIRNVITGILPNPTTAPRQQKHAPADPNMDKVRKNIANERVTNQEAEIKANVLERKITTKENNDDQAPTRMLWTASPTTFMSGDYHGPLNDHSRPLAEQLQEKWDKITCTEHPLPPNISSSLQIAPKIASASPKVGVLVDAARIYFPMKWLYGLVDFLSALSFHIIHFRLTDDQSFVFKSEKYPGLAVPAIPGRNEDVYTVQELTKWVAYANIKGIEIMPEVNIPGHAAAWAGLPGMVMPCANFICRQGYGLPLNVTNPYVLQVVVEVIKEVRKVFTSSSYLHLGGDEVHMSDPCLAELNYSIQNYSQFEDDLQQKLIELKIPLNQVVRWETTTSHSKRRREADSTQTTQHDKEEHRAGNLIHFWSGLPYQLPTKDIPNRFFISTELYFDACLDDGAWNIYQSTIRHSKANATVIIAGTFELGPCTWDSRNVWGKLLAVALGVAVAPSIHQMTNTTQNSNAFLITYSEYCARLGLPQSICERVGKPMVNTSDWLIDHRYQQEAWAATMCHRLTYSKESRVMRIKEVIAENGQQEDHETYEMAAKETVNRYRHLISAAMAQQDEITPSNSIYVHTHNYTGVTVDLARSFFPQTMLFRIIDVSSKLGFNLIHLRLTDNEFFPLALKDFPLFSAPNDAAGQVYTMTSLTEIVNYATKRGVKVVPEINLVGRAGGWAHSGFLTVCPQYLCTVGGSMSLDIRKPQLIDVVASTLGELRQVFAKSPFFHLGVDDRISSMDCFMESGGVNITNNDFDNFERRLEIVLQKMGFQSSEIIRWETGTTISHRRAGSITHYIHTMPSHGKASNYFLSTGFGLDDFGNEDAWEIYQRTRERRILNATGILISTMAMGPLAWESENIFGRMIAVAAGLDEHPEVMHKSTFEASYLNACDTLELPARMCELFGRPLRDASHWLQEKEIQSEKWKNLSCRLFTDLSFQRFPNPSIL